MSGVIGSAMRVASIATCRCWAAAAEVGAYCNAATPAIEAVRNSRRLMVILYSLVAQLNEPQDYLKSLGAKSARARRQDNHSWAVPGDSKYTLWMPACVSSSLNSFTRGPSAEPVDRNRSLTLLLKAAGSANAPPQLVFGSKVPPKLAQLPLKPPK